EVAIPFSTIRYRAIDSPNMGLMVFRSIRRKNEEDYWPEIRLNDRAKQAQVSRFGRLTGLRDLPRQRNLHVKPYLLLGDQKPGTISSGSEIARNAGVDVRYAVTSDTT